MSRFKAEIASINRDSDPLVLFDPEGSEGFCSIDRSRYNRLRDGGELGPHGLWRKSSFMAMANAAINAATYGNSGTMDHRPSAF